MIENGLLRAWIVKRVLKSGPIISCLLSAGYSMADVGGGGFSQALNCVQVGEVQSRSLDSVGLSNVAGNRKILLLRVDFSDLPGAPFTDGYGLNLLTNVSGFFADVSGGVMTVDLPGQGSDLTPTLRLPRPAAYYGTNNLFSQLRADALNAAITAGFDVAAYDFDVVAMGLVPGFTWTGLGIISGPGAYLRGRFDLEITVHELGHNLGLNHAGAWDTGGLSVTGHGMTVEYGDRYDVMGTGLAQHGFHAAHRAWLGWLGEMQTTNVTMSGRWTLTPFDAPNAAGLRSISVVRSAGFGNTNYYHLGHRAFSEAFWPEPGLELHWIGKANQPSLLLDMTPGSPLDVADSPLALGRTFSDLQYGIHFTVVEPLKSSSSRALDLVYYRGSFGGNRSPDLQLTPDRFAVEPGESVRLEAMSSDPDGDALAYYWELGSGQRTTNAPVIAGRWLEPGEFVVRCTVSDMKGGVSTDTVLIRVGAPSTLRLSGQVRSAKGKPLSGVSIWGNGQQLARSSTDGSYDIAGLDSGNYVLLATRDGYDFMPDTFINPLTLSVTTGSIDFRGQARPGEVVRTLIPQSGPWRYLDDGTDPGRVWTGDYYDDNGWLTGLAQMGYGDGDEVTILDYGPFSNNKYISYYFRHAFEVMDPAQVASLKMGLLRDDGAVVYLNGQEIFRSNLPVGPIDFRSLALTTVGGLNENQFQVFNPGPSILREGTNWLAVEVHQGDTDSVDLGFDAWLEATQVDDLPLGIFLVEPLDQARYQEPASLTLRAAVSTGNPELVERVCFYVGDALLGETYELPHQLTWEPVHVGRYSLMARAYGVDGSELQSDIITVHVDRELIGRGSDWKFLYDGSNQSNAWSNTFYDDSEWGIGRAQLGYGDGDEATVLPFGPDPLNKPITAYFRREFTVDEPFTIDQLQWRLLRDDGAVVYLNGLEIGRSNIPEGPVRFDQVAASSSGSDEENIYYEWATSSQFVQAGANMVAVEVHQRSASSSDMGFDLELIASGPGDSALIPRLQVTRVGNGLRLSWSDRTGNWRLEQSLSLGDEAEWTLVPGVIMQEEDFKWYELDPVQGTRFFRLNDSETP